MYVLTVGNVAFLYDRDEKKVGSYLDLERVPAPVRVSRDVRKISITKADLSYENIETGTGDSFNKLLIRANEAISSRDTVKIDTSAKEGPTFNSMQYDSFLQDSFLIARYKSVTPVSSFSSVPPMPP